MMRKMLASKTVWYTAAIAVLAIAFATNQVAAKNEIAIGDPVPDFTMNSIEGEEVTLSDHEGEIVVLSFCSQGCPYSRGTDPHMNAVAKAYGEKGVVFYGIDADRGNSPEDIKGYAKEAEIPYTILKDEQNVFADKVGAARTPEIYIKDKEGNLAYHGAFDNRTVPTQKGDTNYVTDALDELLAGKAVSTPKVSAWGCGIKRVPTS